MILSNTDILYICTYIYSSAKYYQNNEEILQKKLVKDIRRKISF